MFRLISKIKTAQDLKCFFRKETTRRCRETAKEKWYSQKLDALQWHMLQKQVRKWVRGLRKHEDETEQRMIRIRKKLRQWFSL